MSTQRHIIKRQTVEITLAKNQAWELQQALSRIFQRRIPEVLDRCLSEAGRPDCLYRIDRLELDLGELDSRLLETELSERIETTLRQALSEEIVQGQSPPASRQQTSPMSAHLELFEHFVRQGYLPWWADSSQRQLPEKSCAELLNNDPEALKHLLPRLIREPRSLQRLIGYFGDSQLVAIIALLTAAPRDSVTALLQILSAVQAHLHQHSRMPTAHLRAALWQSLLQVAIANELAIAQHGEFLAAVTVRWAKLQGLPQPILTSYFKRLLSSQTPIDNEWLQAIKQVMLKERISVTSAEEAVERSHVTLSKTEPVRQSSTVGQSADLVNHPKTYRYRLAPFEVGSQYAMLRERRFIQPEPHSELVNVEEMVEAGSDNASTGYSIPHIIPLEEGQGDNAVDLSSAKLSPEGRLARMQDDCMDAGGTTPRMGEVEQCMEQLPRAPTVGALGDAGAVAEVEQRREQLPGGNQNKEESLFNPLIPTFSLEGEGARTLNSTALRLGESCQTSSKYDNSQDGSTTDYRSRLDSSVPKTGQAMLNKQIEPGSESSSVSRTGYQANSSLVFQHRPASAVISIRYSKLKSMGGAYSKNKRERLAEDTAAKRAEHRLDDGPSLPAETGDIPGTGEAYGFSRSLPLEQGQGEIFHKSKSREQQQHNSLESQSNNRSAFSETDEVYINNAGLCILWPFLDTFFERLELMQNGRFLDQSAKQCAANLLHYLVYEELHPPEYMLSFNKLLCAMPLESVFDLATPLTTAQTSACDELLEAVIGNAPILNNMTINGFRGSFLLRQGSLSASEGSWLLRVERETYDLVLERFPWSWQWIKLPWMEYPLRVEW